MALALTLKPQERMIIGGAVVKNTGRQTAHLVVETPTAILRQGDVLSQEKAQTPCGQLYLVVQLLYLEPANLTELQESYLSLARDVLGAAPSLSATLQELSLHVATEDYYRALQVGKRLIRLEQELLARI
jgi:flagellar protein FlbT